MQFRLPCRARFVATAVLCCVMVKSHVVSLTEVVDAAERQSAGLVALYDFTEGKGSVIRDRAGVGKSLDLKIGNPKSATWTKAGLTVYGNAKIQSVSAADRLVRRIARSGALTIEAWIHPDNSSLSGPARIVTISKDASNRNLTLGQEQDKFDVRLRASQTSKNGLPSLGSQPKSLATKLMHVVFTRDRSGLTRLYLNGKLNQQGKAQGSLSNWDNSYRLLLADEASGGRAWKGTYRLLALFDRSLTEAEVRSHFQLGAEATTEQVAQTATDHFVTSIAPLLADRCLECHDASNRKGGLDLSRQKLAFAGGDSGVAIAPGKASDSLLYLSVESDDMPHDREPLSPAEKKRLKNWINSGAKWSMDYVDPALFVHGSGESQSEQLWIQRLTTDEYIATVKTTFGVDIEQAARDLLPGDLRADGFANTAYNLNVDLKHIEAYAELARRTMARLDVAQFARRFSESRKFTDKSVGELVEKMGKWVLRGPLTDDEIIVYRGISTTVAGAGGEFDEAVALMLEAMMQSPRFLYRVENQQGDGGRLPVTEFELASRLSYVLWGSSPDEKLFAAADKGELGVPQNFDAQVKRMLADPRFVGRAEQFASQWLNLSGLTNLQPNKERFPEWDPQLAKDMQQETLAFFTQLAIAENRPLSELLTAKVTFATPELAKHYRLKAEASETLGELQRYDLTQDPNRGGLLTHGSVLTIGGDEASMVSRGLFVLHDLLRGVVKDPPPCVDTTPIPTEPGLTQRMIANRRINNEACGGCHSRFEPLAFGLGKFDGLGTFLEEDEHGNRLREDGQVLFPGKAEPVSFNTSQELMRILAASDRVKHSLTWKVVQFSLGRPLTIADASEVDSIHKQSQAQGGTYRSLMEAIVASELIQSARTTADDLVKAE